MLTPSWLARLSRPLEWVNALARRAYARHLLRVYTAPLPVISVGNIALGGTGKTPLVAALARALVAAGVRPAILTRGYRRSSAVPRLVRGGEPLDWRDIGDEPALLAHTLPGVPLVVDADRVRGAMWAANETDATHLILDDGFQHFRLARQLELVATPAADPLCRRRPRREHPRSLRHAHAILLTDAQFGANEEELAALGRYAPGVPVLAVATRPTGVRHRGTFHPPSWLAGRRLHAAAGIASSHRFFALLSQLGGHLERLVPLPDHYPWPVEAIQRLLKEAQAGGAELVVTAKDAIKFPPALAPRVAWLEVEVILLGGSFSDLLRPLFPSSPAGGAVRGMARPEPRRFQRRA